MYELQIWWILHRGNFAIVGGLNSFTDTFTELVGKSVHVRRKTELFRDYHMSQKTKWLIFN